MSSAGKNFLPHYRRAALTRAYALRLLAVAALLASLVVATASVLLTPAYYAAHVRAAREAAARGASSTAQTRVAALMGEEDLLASLALTPAASDRIRTLLAVSRPGITLSRFLYVPGVSGAAATLAVSGMAADRETLRRYQTALESNAAFEGASLPLAAFATDANIPFTVTLTLAP